MSCAIFYLLAVQMPLGHGSETGMLVLLTCLACVEKLNSIMNLVSVERDWVSPSHARNTPSEIVAHGVGN